MLTQAGNSHFKPIISNQSSVFIRELRFVTQLALFVLVSLGVATSLTLCFTLKHVAMKQAIDQFKMKNMSRALKVFYNPFIIYQLII